MDDTRAWYWEGNVVLALRRHLEREGWEIVRMADTRLKERGVDLQASKGGRTLLVEVKGYPLKGYSDPRRAGEIKPTAQRPFRNPGKPMFVVSPHNPHGQETGETASLTAAKSHSELRGREF
ncbi:hypothetical protein VSX64_12505 [Aurantimonas sp. C2-6-R+9]|uniref:hypothetical protein n=1 Tax=unclassified Aurantimonas TaxID=2638230 RepID=UPI002E17701A|nr:MULTISPECIES: hypothetical protein [unclassified Aurantimonas]MEC5291429.1 hypothetical protein [Aurantimonas sp. C2-3-R2]MEC5381693.1 hypothetical protein [Aurantimonas sp. C2-6-R+9]MEC5412517.1 hypothetical protein [Aurantimonas sp. C2-4-R8]